ncbi:MAG TPA: redoxin domain-containing protein [Methylomirabilota bacterium]|jgi:thiol-disulfide isomerase/thioredoxin
MRRERGAAAGALALAALALAVGLGALGVPVTEAQRGARIGQPAPEITGGPWLNSEPLSLAGLRGRVVFVEFWTFGCINCRNVLPQLRAWHERYQAAGLTIVGVHSPEFLWEKPPDRVAAAVRELDVRYAVVQDNDFAIWKRFGTWAWPTAVLVDRRGVIRYTHIGEGAYAETEAMIRGLLDERG